MGQLKFKIRIIKMVLHRFETFMPAVSFYGIQLNEEKVQALDDPGAISANELARKFSHAELDSVCQDNHLKGKERRKTKNSSV